MASKAKVTVFVFLILLMFNIFQRSVATRGLNIKESSVAERKKIVETLTAIVSSSKMMLKVKGPMVFAMLPRDSIPPAGPIGGIDNNNP